MNKIIVKRPCAHPGCNQLVIKPACYCEEHKKANNYDSNRPNSYRRGYTKAWQRYRAQFLAEHPVCVACLRRGEISEATVVDHIVPHKGDMKRFWDKSNHQALCKHCHDSKTAREDGGFGR